MNLPSIPTLNHKLVQAQAETPAGWQRIILLIVLGYEAAGAKLGGILLIAAPDGRYMEMPVSMMHGAFRDFLVPGILLLGLGMLNGLAFLSVLRKTRYDWFFASAALSGLIIWFVVEIIILSKLHWLHLMWGLPVLLGCIVTIPLIAQRKSNTLFNKNLLICGILASVWYIAINVFVPILYDGYHIASYTVSELSAINAPTRILWVLLVLPYPILTAAFGWGVLQLPAENRSLKLVGYFLVTYSILNLYWPPMHMRGIEPSLTDTLHIVWAIQTNIFMWLFMIFGAKALDKQFRIYTFISIALHILFGVLTSLEAPNIPINGATPMIGIWERVNIFIFMVWMIVFATALIRRSTNVHSLVTTKAASAVL